jgi:hypothetical protein
LNGVSCASATACTAVGENFEGTTESTFAETWDGSTWTAENTPSPGSDSTRRVLNAVSCTSATACTAVGQSGGAGLAELWDGTSWTVQPLPNEAGVILNAISCASSVVCMAVGSSPSPSGTSQALADLYS